MGLFKRFVNQTRKPEGILGRFLVAGMNPGHSRLADWGMSCFPSMQPARIAELGCGGGRNVRKLLKRYPAARVTAVDYSPLSVEMTEAYNRRTIEEGRCMVLQGDVSALTLEKRAYDLATAFETVYFWPGIESCFAQVYEILKPEGTFVIVNESDGHDATGQKFEKIIEGMKVYTSEQLKAALLSAGFSNVALHHHDRKPWITLAARK